MKLANKVYIATLLLLTFVFVASAQSDARSEKDPRNTAPTVGTGGPVGGPTGLFTVYDGSTLRQGEYTFSAAYSNYDRDPGAANITDVPLSFQIGLTNNIEVFFNTDAYRGIKINAPRNLSSFYLPNSQLFIGGFGLTSPPAIVLSPQGPGVSLYPNTAVFRPTGSGWVPFPYSGGNAGIYQAVFPFFSGPIFGFPAGTNALLGPPRPGGRGASLFPGVGSVYGGILPGLVLQTQIVTPVTGGRSIEVPTIFTLGASYLPDAPFVHNTYGQSSFNSFDVGVKWRFTDVKSAIGFGVMAAYTFYADNADTASGFNQLQHGASPGGNMGDITVALFADARVARWANLSANVGYKWTSAVKSNASAGTFTLLDRPDELQSSVGVDFPINRYFQPIAEFRSLYYVGGRTKNVFQNNPMDAIFGVRIYPVRWAGFGVAYRYYINQQNADSFDKTKTVTLTATVPCTSTQVVGNAVAPVCNGNTTYTSTYIGMPPGFVASTDPHGFILQAWIGRRQKRQGDIINLPPVVDSVDLSATVISLGCAPGYKSRSGACNDSRTINVATKAHDPENDVMTYNYTVSGGRIVGSGANVQWDLTGAQAGTYTITTGVDDGCGVCGKTNTQSIKVQECPDCMKMCDCPTLSVSGPSGVTKPGDTMTFVLNGAPSDSNVNWSVSAGTIESGQGTSSITVRAPADGSVSNITATADLPNLQPGCDCPHQASETGGVAQPPLARLVDEFGAEKDDVVKARIDAFYIELNNNPDAKGYVINYGTAKQIAHRKAQIMKAINFRKYDVNRLVWVDGGDAAGGERTKLWLVPAGANPPSN